MRRLRRVKIIATLGPASQDHQTIAALFDAGVDVFRINMSHGTHEDLHARVKMLRAIEKEKHRPIGILVDLHRDAGFVLLRKKISNYARCDYHQKKNQNDKRKAYANDAPIIEKVELDFVGVFRVH
jgi:pyruvate kinase